MAGCALEVWVTWCQTTWTIKESGSPQASRGPAVPPALSSIYFVTFWTLVSSSLKIKCLGQVVPKISSGSAVTLLRQSLPHLLTSQSKILGPLFYSSSIFQEKGQFLLGHNTALLMPSSTLLAQGSHNFPHGKCLLFFSTMQHSLALFLSGWVRSPAAVLMAACADPHIGGTNCTEVVRFSLPPAQLDPQLLTRSH